MNSRLKWLILIPLVAAAPGCRKQEVRTVQATESPAVEARVLDIALQSFTASVAVTGTLVSRSHVDVKAEITGRITRFDKEEGNPVKAGETVVWVDEDNYRLAARQAQSAVDVAEAALEKARILEAHSKAESERADHLVKSGGITDKDLKLARVTEQDARAQVALAQAQLAQARTALDLAAKRLRDCQIHAPVSGEIQKKYVNVGAYAEPPTQLFSIVDNSRLELESPVASADLAPLCNGQRVTFKVPSFPDTTFEGTVQEINPAVDADSRAARLRIRVDNRSGRLKAGMFAEGEIITGVVSQAVVIPLAAVYRDDQSARASYVFVVQDGKATRRAVRIGRERDNNLEITRGLKPGDRLIAEQSIEVAEGVRIAARQ